VTLSGSVENESTAHGRVPLCVLGFRREGSREQSRGCAAPPMADVQPQEEPAPVETPRQASKPRAERSSATAYSQVRRRWPPRRLRRRWRVRRIPAHPPPPAAPSAPAASVPATPAPPPPPRKVTIPSGTNLAIRLVDAIDSETAQPGQSFRATLDSPLSVDGDIVVPSGHDVTGHIVGREKRRKICRQIGTDPATGSHRRGWKVLFDPD